MRCSLLGIGTGLLRPLSSTSPREFLMHSMPVSRPSCVRIRTGDVRVSIFTPSLCAASTSSAKAGISWSVRR